jgi:hypothetical protein
MDGSGLRFGTMDHGGEYSDTMPQAIKLTDSQGRSCIYVPMMQDGKVVDSQGYTVDIESDKRSSLWFLPPRGGPATLPGKEPSGTF